MRELDLELLRERLSPHALHILSCSIEESRRRNHNFLAGEHILFALCKHEPELIQCFCSSSLNFEHLTEQTKDFLDKTHPHVGRSLKMTPELQRTMRIAWENAQQNHRNHMESFDLLEALQKHGTSAVWQKIREAGFSQDEIHANFKRYEKDYFIHQRTRVRRKDGVEAGSIPHETANKLMQSRASMPSTLKFVSAVLVLCIMMFVILAIIRC